MQRRQKFTVQPFWESVAWSSQWRPATFLVSFMARIPMQLSKREFSWNLCWWFSSSSRGHHWPPQAGTDISTARKANCTVVLYSTATPVLLNFTVAVLAVNDLHVCRFRSLQFFYSISPQIFVSLIPPLTTGHIHVFRLLCLIYSRAVPAAEGRTNVAPPPPNCCFFLSSFHMWQCCFSSDWSVILHEMLEKSIFFLIETN